MAWTDDELRAAIVKSIAATPPLRDHADFSVDYIRAILAALGIDHQPKPELPTEPGSMIYDVETTVGACSVMTLDRSNWWMGVCRTGGELFVASAKITSFGGVLDLDKVRGEQGE